MAQAPQSTSAIEEHSVFRSLFSAYPDALLLVDAAGSIVLANPAASVLLGYSLEELSSLTVDTLVPDSIRPRHAALRDAYARNPRPRPMGTQMELVAKRRDGSEVMVEIALSPLHDDGLPYVVAAVRDIGAYPRVKQALKRARYSEFVAQMGRLAVDTRDSQSLLEKVPAVAAEALEVEASVLYLLEGNGQEFRVAGGIGLLPHEAINGRIANRPDTPPGFVLSEGRPVVVADFREDPRFEEVSRTYLDAGIVSVLSVPLSDRGRAVGVLSVRSRQPRRFGDEEVRFMESLANLLAASLQRTQSEEALSHAQRLESVGQLTGGIAHDFNNLLTVIQGNLQVLEELPAVAGDEFTQQLVEAATRASRRGAELTGKLLAFSRRQVLSPASVDVNALVQSLAGMLRRTVDQRIQIELETAPGCPPCLADPVQLESALLNIAINARDAMPSGGRLLIRARLSNNLPPPVVVAETGLQPSAEQAYVSIAITDTGTGMSEAVKERAFEPFFTTKEAGRGTGLGLSTVYGFVKQSHGAITLESSPGAGTTVTLYIPVLAGAPARSVEAPADAVAGLRGMEVLVVEDEPEVREVLRNFLASLGCAATFCANAEEGLLRLSQQRFDLLLSDVALGAGMRGTELARQARERVPGLGILLMSGYSAALLQPASDSPLSCELLGKPYTREQLAQAIGRAMLAVRASQD